MHLHCKTEKRFHKNPTLLKGFLLSNVERSLSIKEQLILRVKNAVVSWYVLAKAGMLIHLKHSSTKKAGLIDISAALCKFQPT